MQERQPQTKVLCWNLIDPTLSTLNLSSLSLLHYRASIKLHYRSFIKSAMTSYRENGLSSSNRKVIYIMQGYLGPYTPRRSKMSDTLRLYPPVRGQNSASCEPRTPRIVSITYVILAITITTTSSIRWRQSSFSLSE